MVGGSLTPHKDSLLCMHNCCRIPKGVHVHALAYEWCKLADENYSDILTATAFVS